MLSNTLKELSKMWVPAPGPRALVLRPDTMAEFGNNKGSLIEQECQYYNSHK